VTVEREMFYPKNRRVWRKWLEKHHASSSGIWLMYYKKHTGQPTVSYDESVEEALCFGWIDSKPAKLDDERHLLYFCPRKPKSVWSKLNKSRLERLLEAGLMAPAGLLAIEVAKKNGAWTAIDASENMLEPDDLVMQLERNSRALEFWRQFPPGVRKTILQWILSAKRPETRAKRIEETVRLAAENVRSNQWRQ
jgi:uncharacterized protein YdeI (YjbR/CyaY-like superfamily)